jgi:hypothetical protein
MRKSLALILTVCLGALAVGCEPEVKPTKPAVPQSDLGSPAGKGDGAKADGTKDDGTKSPAATTPPAKATK